MSAVTSPTSPASTALPSRAATMGSMGEEAIPEADPSTTAGLLAERLTAWRHAVQYIEDYMEAMEKIHGKHAKEYERALKVISHPLKEGHHFDQSLGGVAGFFENMRTNTQAMINTNLETEKSIKGSILPVVERLSKEIKHKSKELANGATKGSKEVAKARNDTQKHIELLGQHTASYDSAGGKFSGSDDPYVIHRGILHRLSSQVLAENNHHNDLIAVQNNFATFEAHIIEVIQSIMEGFAQLAGGQAEKTRALHNDMLGTIQRVPPEFEWANFTQRNAERLAQPNEPPRSVDSVTFPNMDHASTKPLIEGSLERKSRNKLSWGYSAGYYVVTPAKFLHEFKDSDNTRADPKPELSIYLPDATIGAPNGDKFTIKGKDKSKTMSSRFATSSELGFKAHTAADAEKWFGIIRGVAGATGPVEPHSPVVGSGSTPTSPLPTDDKTDKYDMNSPTNITPVEAHKGQESGVMGGTAPAPTLDPNPAPASAATPAVAPPSSTAATVAHVDDKKVPEAA